MLTPYIHPLAASHVNSAHFIFWTFAYHKHSLLQDPARQAALFSFIHNAPDFSCTVDPSGLHGDWADLYRFYSAGATTLIVVSLLAHQAFYRRGNLRGAWENDQSCSLMWGLLSLQEEKCNSTGQLFIDCNNLDPAVYSLTPDNQLWILICLAQWYWSLGGVCSCFCCVFLHLPSFPEAILNYVSVRSLSPLYFLYCAAALDSVSNSPHAGTLCIPWPLRSLSQHPLLWPVYNAECMLISGFKEF